MEILTTARENITLATMAQIEQPFTWASKYARAFRQLIPPKAASTKETTGLKCAPDTGPTMRIKANSPAPVAAAFSRSSRPVFPGESRWAAIPDPTTTAVRKAEPTNSPARRRQRGFSATGLRFAAVARKCQQHAGGGAETADVHPSVAHPSP